MKLPDRWKPDGETLGQGGQAQVFRVEDKTGKCAGKHAIKVLTDSRRSPRLRIEVATAKSLVDEGAALLPIVDDYLEVDSSAEHPWYVTRVASDGDLSKHLHKGEPFGGSVATSLRMMKEIADAVGEIHKLQVAHRDLKPSNILLDAGKVYLCDLGLCLPLDGSSPIEQLTTELERIGSFHYTPKEAFGGTKHDRGALAFDAYALGKILYELLAGQVLPGFRPPSDPEYDLTKLNANTTLVAVNSILRELLHDEPSRRLVMLNDLSRQLVQLIEREESHKSRVSTKAELSAGLSRAAASVARMVVGGKTTVIPTDEWKTTCEELVGGVHRLWESNASLKMVDEAFVKANPDYFELCRLAVSSPVRDTMFPPLGKSRQGWDPLNQAGYPRFPATETGCAVGVLPRGDAQKVSVELWVLCLAAAKAEGVHVGFAVVRKENGIDRYSDIVADTVRVMKGGLHDAVLLGATLEAAEQAAQGFAEILIKEFGSRD